MKKFLAIFALLLSVSGAVARHGGGHGGGFHGGGHGGYHGGGFHGGRGGWHGGYGRGGFYGGRGDWIAPAVIGTGLTAAALAANNGDTYYTDEYYY